MGPLGDPATAVLSDDIDDEEDMGKAGYRAWPLAIGLVAARISRRHTPAGRLFGLTPREFAPEP
jgi:hypothetical protein